MLHRHSILLTILLILAINPGRAIQYEKNSIGIYDIRFHSTLSQTIECVCYDRFNSVVGSQELLLGVTQCYGQFGCRPFLNSFTIAPMKR